MPNKDINKRREAYHRWASKNVDKRRNYQRILWKARRANVAPQKCLIKGCNNLGERHHPDYSKPEEIVWICKSHHRRMFHSGKCKICGDRVLARGFCNKHYKSERKRIDPEYRRREREQKRKSLPTGQSIYLSY